MPFRQNTYYTAECCECGRLLSIIEESGYSCAASMDEMLELVKNMEWRAAGEAVLCDECSEKEDIIKKHFEKQGPKIAQPLMLDDLDTAMQGTKKYFPEDQEI